MAGIGFSLRSLGANRNGYAGLLSKYGAAGVISSGPWLMSILTLLFIGVLGRTRVPEAQALTRFQVSVTWLFAASLVVVGPLQLAFTRTVSDLAFARREDRVFAQLLGIMTFTSLGAATLALAVMPWFAGESLAYRALMTVGFVSLCNVWLVMVTLSDLRAHRAVLTSFALGYGVTFAATMLLARWGATGLLGGFVVGQAALLMHGLRTVARQLPRGAHDVDFGFLFKGRLRLDLLAIGLIYNLSIWCDKLMFWTWEGTSHSVIGPLRASELYDLPIFLAYLTIVPSMAVFLVRVETDFAEQHERFYSSIREGATLARIERDHQSLTRSAREALTDILKTQAFTFALCLLAGPALLGAAGISELHLPLFYIDAAGVGLQVLLLGVTSMFFYLDRRGPVLVLVGLLLTSNVLLTWASHALGPAYYGYGFALAMTITSTVGITWLNRTFRHLVPDTFMRQPVG